MLQLQTKNIGLRRIQAYTGLKIFFSPYDPEWIWFHYQRDNGTENKKIASQDARRNATQEGASSSRQTDLQEPTPSPAWPTFQAVEQRRRRGIDPRLVKSIACDAWSVVQSSRPDKELQMAIDFAPIGRTRRAAGQFAFVCFQSNSFTCCIALMRIAPPRPRILFENCVLLLSTVFVNF